MPRVEFILHKGAQILDLDCRGSKDVNDNIAIFQKAQKMAMLEPLKSVKLITDVSDAHYDSDGVKAMKAFSKAVTPHMKASAAVGVTGLKKIILQSLIMLTGREIRLFDTREQALEWLVGQ